MYKIDRRGGGGAGGVQKNGILGQITLCYFVLRLSKNRILGNYPKLIEGGRGTGVQNLYTWTDPCLLATTIGPLAFSEMGLFIEERFKRYYHLIRRIKHNLVSFPLDILEFESHLLPLRSGPHI